MKKLCKELFEIVMNSNSDMDLLDWANINDYYMFLTLDLLQEFDEVKIDEYIRLFEEFSHKASYTDRFYEGFFLTLAHMLSLKFEVKRMKVEEITREQWKLSFVKTLERLGLQKYLNKI